MPLRGAFAAITVLLCSVSAYGEVLTLEQAIEGALGANRSVQGSAIGVRRFDDQLASLRTRRFPALSINMLGGERLTRLDFTFDQGVLGSLPGIGPIPAQKTIIETPRQLTALLQAEAAQPLSQLYKIHLNLDLLRIGRNIAQQQDREQRQTIINQVKRTYYGILQAQSALQAVQEAIRLYRELDRLTEQYVEQQVALKSQSLEIKARLAKAEYDALTLQNPLDTQKEQLNSLLARDIRTEFTVSAIPDGAWEPGDLASARKAAIERRPELKEARLKAEQARFDRRVKRSEYIPDVSLTLDYLSPLNYGSLVPSNIAIVGLNAKWEPFDWGRKTHELAEKSKVIDQAALAVHETEDQILIDVGNRFRKLMEARQLLTVTQLTQETARENLRVATDRYKQDSALVKDVLQMQAGLADANNQYQQALLAFYTARADFEKSLGDDK